MSEQQADLKKLVVVATDLGLSVELRAKAIKLIANLGDHDALVALLGLVANDRLTRGERELAIKYAREMVRAGH